MRTLSIGRTGQSYSAASLKSTYQTQLAELPAKIAAKPGWTTLYMSDVEILRGRADALADIESEFADAENWAVEQGMTTTEMLLLKYDVVAEMAIDVAAILGSADQIEYHKGRYQTVRDVMKHLRRDPYFPGNEKKEGK